SPDGAAIAAACGVAQGGGEPDLEGVVRSVTVASHRVLPLCVMLIVRCPRARFFPERCCTAQARCRSIAPNKVRAGDSDAQGQDAEDAREPGRARVGQSSWRLPS